MSTVFTLQTCCDSYHIAGRPIPNKMCAFTAPLNKLIIRKHAEFNPPPHSGSECWSGDKEMRRRSDI